MFLVDDHLRRAAERTPDQVALVGAGRAEQRRLTYAELDGLVERAAGALTEAGARRGDRVVIVADNGVDPVVAAYGAMRAGACFSLLHPATKPKKVGEIVARCEPTVLVLGGKQVAAEAEILAAAEGITPPRVLHLGGSFDEALAAAPARFRQPWRIDLDLCAIFWTSGSTGIPKGVMLAHQNMKSTSVTVSNYLGNVASDVVLTALPLSFGYGWFQLTAAFRVGARVVLERGFTMAFPLVDAIRREQATGIPGVPTLFALLLSLREIDPAMLASLRYWTVAGAAMAPAHVKRMREIAPQARPFVMYGLTECTRVTYLPPEDLDKKPMSVGLGMPNQDCWVEAEDGRRAAPGEVGELIVRGANVMRGYWRDPEGTEKALRPGRFPGEVELRSGDLFKTDEDGYLYFVARKDDIIKSGGQKVSPREIEAALLEHPGIAECAVIPTDDALLGQVAKAFVVARPGMTLEIGDIRKHLMRLLEDYMVPKHYAVVDALPRSENGKIVKKDLR